MGFRRSIRVTPEGTRFLFFALAVAVAAVNTGNNLFYLLLAMMLSLIIISGLLSELCLRRLGLHRRLPDYVFANEAVQTSILVSNRKSCLPSVSLRLCDLADGIEGDRTTHVPHLPPRASSLSTYRFSAPRRGLYRFQGVRVATSFPFGLFEKRAFYPHEATMLVCPELVPLRPSLLRTLASIGQEQSLARRGPGMGLHNLREYRPGDDSRAIHWMTTARTSKLMVKETEAEDQRAITIAMSSMAPETHEAAFERALSVTAALITHFYDRDYLIRAVIGAEDFGPDVGSAHYLRILEALALCRRQEPGAPPSDHVPQRLGQSDAGIIVAVVPWPGDDGSARMESADCVISTAQAGEPVYVIGPSPFA